MRTDSTLDFSKCPYNIEGIPEGEMVIDKFSDLTSLAHIFLKPDLPEGADPDKVMRYLIYMFAPNNPVRVDFPDINRRKQYVLNKLNIEVDEYSPYMGLVAMTQDWAVDRFIAFTHLFRNEDYRILSIAEVRIAQFQKYVLTAKIDKATDEGHFWKSLETIRETVEQAKKRITDGEQSKFLEETVSYSVKTNSLGIMPEEYTVAWRDTSILFEEVIP